MKTQALSKNVPQPFKAEPTGGGGTRMHRKFIVIDFDKPTARAYMGSYKEISRKRKSLEAERHHCLLQACAFQDQQPTFLWNQFIPPLDNSTKRSRTRKKSPQPRSTNQLSSGSNVSPKLNVIASNSRNDSRNHKGSPRGWSNSYSPTNLVVS